MTETSVPLHLAGNNAPVTDEVTLEPTHVVGAIPMELSGHYFRNGPNPRTGWSAHMFDGDGMVHAMTLENGGARWYRNRFVRTPLYANPGVSRFDLAFDGATRRIDYRVTTANTHVVSHAGRLLALEEGGLPYEMSASLDTFGPYDFGGRLRTPMTAHPKVCPTTGELLFFGYQLRPPYLTYHRASPAGEIEAAEAITLPRATMMHDFAITATNVVFMDSPIVFDAGAMAEGGSPWRWDDDHGARFGVMPRHGNGADIRWYDVETCHLSHALNAYDDGDELVVTGTRLPGAAGLPAMHEWRVHVPSGRVTERALDDTSTEYPRLPDARVGLSHRYGYCASFVMEAEPDYSVIYKYDLRSGGTRRGHHFPPGHTCGEPVFVPRTRGADEDDGYLLTFAHDRGRGTSYLAILDAADVEVDAIAEVHVPVRIPGGFHGSWIPITG